MDETPAPVDLAALPGAGGVVWSVSADGFHTNLVVLAPSGEIAAHRNDAIDVLLVVLAGSGTVTIDAAPMPVTPMSAVLVPRGAVRSVAANSDGLRYLTIHERRPPLTIGRTADA